MSEIRILMPFDAAEACTIAEAVRISGCSDETIRRWTALHHLGRKIGGRWRVSRAALQMHLDGNKPALRDLLAGNRGSQLVRPYLEAVETSKKDASKPTEPTHATNGYSA